MKFQIKKKPDNKENNTTAPLLLANCSYIMFVSIDSREIFTQRISTAEGAQQRNMHTNR